MVTYLVETVSPDGTALRVEVHALPLAAFVAGAFARNAPRWATVIRSVDTRGERCDDQRVD